MTNTTSSTSTCTCAATLAVLPKDADRQATWATAWSLAGSECGCPWSRAAREFLISTAAVQ